MNHKTFFLYSLSILSLSSHFISFASDTLINDVENNHLKPNSPKKNSSLVQQLLKKDHLAPDQSQLSEDDEHKSDINNLSNPSDFKDVAIIEKEDIEAIDKAKLEVIKKRDDIKKGKINFGFKLAFSDFKEDENMTLFSHEKVHKYQDSIVTSHVTIKQSGKILWNIQYKRIKGQGQKTVSEFQLFYTYTRGKDKSSVFTLTTPFIYTHEEVPYYIFNCIPVPFFKSIEYSDTFCSTVKMTENSFECKQVKHVEPSSYFGLKKDSSCTIM